MVQTGKLAVITILTVLGLGALGGGWYVGNTYIPDLLEEGIKDSLVVDENYEEDDLEGYQDWLTNEDADDVPKYKRYYLWNLTNSDEYLAGADPVYKELGPYAYRQYDIKLSPVITATTVSYKTYTYYEFDAAESTGSETDVIVNVNPAYLGVLEGIGSEAALVTGFVGPTISQLFAGMQGEFTDGAVALGIATAMAQIMGSLAGDFVSNVKVQGTALALNTTLTGLMGEFPETVLTQAVALGLLEIQAGITEQFHIAVNATMAANVMHGNWLAAQTLNGTDIANEDFFNSTSFYSIYNTFVGASAIQGLGEISGGLPYSNDTITNLLWDGPSVAPGFGWFADLAQGSGVLLFLELYENATLGLGGLDKATLGGFYGGLTDTQLDAAANYLLNYLITDNLVIEGSHVGTFGVSTLAAAQAMFKGQWANATTLPGGADINGDGSTPDGFEVGIPVASELSTLAVDTLFDPTNPLSLTNDAQGVFVWIFAANGDAANQTLLETTYTGLINATQFAILYPWVKNFRDVTTHFGLLAKFAPLGVTQLTDLGFVHWGSNVVTTGLSLFDLKPELGAYPEPWAWSSNVDSGTFTLNMSNSENLLTGAYNLTDITSVVTFLQLGAAAAAGDGTSLDNLNGFFGTQLDQGNVTMLLSYLTYIVDTFVLNELPVSSYADLPAFQWGHSAVTEGFSVNEISPVGFYPEVWAYVARVLSGSLLFDGATSLALTTGLQTPEGVGAFLVYGTSAAAGNDTALGIINGAFGGTTLTGAQAGNVTSYLGYLLTTLVHPAMGVTTNDDIAFAHWGSSIVTGGLSLSDLAPELGLPNVPEFWAYASNVLPMNLTLDQSKALLTGDNSLLNSTTVGMILTFKDALMGNDTATIGMFNGLLGDTFTAIEYQLLVGYIGYMMQDYVADWVLAPTIAAGGGLIATKTVEQWLWSYEDPLLVFLKANGLVEDAAWAFFTPHTGPTDPNIDAASTVMTGADDVNNVLTYVNWRGLESLPSRVDDPVNGVWDHEEFVIGTDGTQFHPDVKEHEELKIWLSDINRTIEIVYSEDTEKEGIDLLRFVLSEEVLGVDPAFDQTVNGIGNMTYSQGGVPLMVSKPAFLDADASVHVNITGVTPVYDKHETFIDVEPITGAVLNAAKRLQISFLIGAGNFLTSSIKENHYMPVVWVEEGGAITPDLAKKFKDKIYGAQQIQDVAPIAGAAIGAVLILTSMFIAVRSRKP